MKKERAVALLQHINSKHTGYRSDWVLGPCPMAPWKHESGKDAHPSFGIKASEKKKSICKCLSCGYGGDLQDLLLDLSYHLKRSPAPGYNMSAASQLIANEFDELEIDGHSIPEYGDGKFLNNPEVVFPEYWLSTFQSVSKFPEAMDYLRDRGLTLKIIKEMDIRFDPIQRRVGFPFRNASGGLMGIQGRALDPQATLRYFQYGYKNHRNMHCWMGEDRLDLDRPVVVLEGPFDLTSVFRVYQNVAASFTSGLSKEKIRRLSDASEIITFYDHGKGGDAARERLSDVLKGHPITHLIPTPEEDDAGAMSIEQVSWYLQQHVKLNNFG